MSLFKSKEERRMERNLQLKSVIVNIQRQIQKTEGHRRKYVDMAKRAMRNGQRVASVFFEFAIRPNGQ